MLDAKAREALKGFYGWTGRTLARLGFTANSLTVLGIVLTAVAGWRITVGGFPSAGLILTAGGCLDFCDGAVAKARGTASVLGAFFDSVTDRVSDAIVFSALTWHFLRTGHPRAAIIALVAYGTSVMTSYIRAKAESLGFDSKIGVLERAERLIVICSALILSDLWAYLVESALWVIAIFGAITVLQRLVHVARQARVAD
jgi:CDP-diacylglycerol---glycerol-3-phosphate 3-phosphatidyltransferase